MDSKFEPWKTIWLQPRRTMVALGRDKPGPWVVSLAASWGLVKAAEQATRKHLGERLDYGELVLLILLGGPILGILFNYLEGELISRSGRWLGGRGRPSDIRLAAAWGRSPKVLVGVAYCGLWLLLGEQLFQKGTYQAVLGSDSFLLGTCLLLAIVGNLWSLSNTLVCVSEVHGFSTMRALGAYLVGILAVFLPALAALFLGLSWVLRAHQ